MRTEDRRVCPSCGNEFSGAGEFCPVCMLHGAPADDVESGESSSERVTKPKSQDVARRFQHRNWMTSFNKSNHPLKGCLFANDRIASRVTD
jgi:predicted amidophosphoribosyltransferase